MSRKKERFPSIDILAFQESKTQEVWTALKHNMNFDPKKRYRDEIITKQGDIDAWSNPSLVDFLEQTNAVDR